jgi:hypothetical protein
MQWASRLGVEGVTLMWNGCAPGGQVHLSLRTRGATQDRAAARAGRARGSPASVAARPPPTVARPTPRAASPLPQGITLYQTDWSLSAVTMRVLAPSEPASGSGSGPAPASPLRQAAMAAAQASSPQDGPGDAASSSREAARVAQEAERTAFNLPMASLEGRPGIAGRLWATFLPLGEPPADGSAPKGISSEWRDRPRTCTPRGAQERGHVRARCACTWGGRSSACVGSDEGRRQPRGAWGVVALTRAREQAAALAPGPSRAVLALCGSRGDTGMFAPCRCLGVGAGAWERVP